ncbi:MAG: FAD-dependent oxidoreductase, partial [Acidimicrobiia bacterium]
MTAPTDPAAAFLAQLQTATSVVEIYRSSFPSSEPFSAGFDTAVAWLRANKPEVKLEILTDPMMADTLVFFRTDATVSAGPLWAPSPAAWLQLDPLGITPDNFDQFFGDQRNKLAHPEVIQPYNATPEMPDGTTLINDFSRLNETAAREVLGKQHLRWPWSAFPPTEADLCNVVAEAARNGHQISIAGKRHSQGGHTFFEGAVVIDITDFNEILSFDPVAKTIVVQSGTTWDQIQRFVAPHGLSVQIMQAYPFFTVGGSLGVSVHESDLRFGPII